MTYRILCVDDEEQILAVFREAFEGIGYEVFTAKSGVDALVIVKERQPHIVFLDVIMPEMRGVEVLTLIHEIDPDIAVIMISGQASEQQARELLANGAFDYLPKPIDLKHLFDVVAQWRFGVESENAE